VTSPVTIVETTAAPIAVIAARTTWERFPAEWPALLEEVWSFVRSTDVKAGRNVMLYRDDVPNVEVGVEVESAVPSDGRVVASSLPAGRAASTIARGAPGKALGQAHEAVLAWCAEHGHELSRCRWEVYGHWREDQDPELYETEVYWLLAT
jgi:effector-binding domain-containing protein